MIVIDNTGAVITPHVGREAVFQGIRSYYDQLRLSWKMHPAQKAAAMNCASSLDVLASRPPAAVWGTFCGIPIAEDPSLPPDVVQLRADDEVIVTIKNLGTPKLQR